MKQIYRSVGYLLYGYRAKQKGVMKNHYRLALKTPITLVRY